MEFRREEIKSETDYNNMINDYVDGELKNNGGMIIPNPFEFNIETKAARCGTINNQNVYKTLYIKRNFSTINSCIWNELAVYNKALPFIVIGYIANRLGFDSNIAIINYDSICSYMNKAVSRRDYFSVINMLESRYIIKRTNKKSIFAVNPLMIYKGSIEKFAEVVTSSEFNKTFIIDDKLCIDKLVFYERKTDKDPVLIKNRKYYNNVDLGKSISGNESLRMRIDFSRRH